jgi:5S rRNA maturation endonuclease (ribonuclease M5)
MPIQGQSEIIRLDRLGKIRLGERVPDPKHEGQTIPRARDYFVVPPEVQAVYGSQPKELTITFPTDDESRFLREEYRCYGRSYMLSCHGDGIHAMQKTDLQTGAMVDRDTTGDWEWREMTCDPDTCPMYTSKQCRPMMSLQFMLPEVPGLGVWELTTTSRHSRLNIRGTLHLVRWATGGRVRFIPLKLTLGPQDVVPPKGTKKTVWIVHLRQDFKLSDLQQAALTSPERSFLPPGTVLALPEPDIDKAPEDLVGPFEGETQEGEFQEVGTVSTPEGVAVVPVSSPATPGGTTSDPAQPEQKPPVKKVETKGAKTETKPPPAETKGQSKMVATYDYTDAEGTLLFQTLRYSPKDFRQRRPDGKGKWLWNLDGVNKVLYHLPEVLEAIKKGMPIYIVEGEKDVESLQKLGLVATTNPMGAGKWRPEYSESLAGAKIVLLRDEDEAGRKHAAMVVKSLTGKVNSVVTQELPGDSKDVSDWLETGGTKAELERLVGETSNLAKINIEKLAREILGAEGMTGFVMPEMVRLFGEKARLPDLDDKQLEILAESIQKEKLSRKSVIAFPPEDEPQRLALRKQLNSALKAKFDGDVDRCVGWLKERYNTTTSETLSLAELKVALERSKETEPGAAPDFPLF